MKKFIPEIKEVRYIEAKEQEQQKLTAEQEQELVENSYYLENEAWSDISAPKGYGPYETVPKEPWTSRWDSQNNHYSMQPLNGNCPVGGSNCFYSISNRKWICIHHNYFNRQSNSSTNSSSSSSSTTSTVFYYCARLGCYRQVTRSGQFCYAHGGMNN